MKALMSEKLREIISDPQGSKELQRGISSLSNKTDCDKNKSTEISVGSAKYRIQFVQRNQDIRDK
jgi:hypothetical protein